MTFRNQPVPFPRHAPLGPLGSVCRLGLASRGNTHLSADAVMKAVRRGVNLLNWCGSPDGMSEAIRRLGHDRRDVRISVQIEARSAEQAEAELRNLFRELGTTHIDAATYYYVEHPNEWEEILGPGGAAEALNAAKAAGKVRLIGVTSHQRGLAADFARSGGVDLIMVRYNAAHRGAEDDVFPVTARLGMPVITYTGLRWGALLENTPADPPGFTPPPAPDWYRFVLSHPAVTAVLMAPDNDHELAENLAILDDWRPLTPERYRELCEHGDRVRRHSGQFP